MVFTYLNSFKLSLHISLISLKLFLKKLSINYDSISFGNLSINFYNVYLKNHRIFGYLKCWNNWNKLFFFCKSPKIFSLVINNTYNVLLFGKNYIFILFDCAKCFLSLLLFIRLFIKFFCFDSFTFNQCVDQLLFNFVLLNLLFLVELPAFPFCIFVFFNLLYLSPKLKYNLMHHLKL